MDKNRYILPTREGKTDQQKRHLLQDAFSNGGADWIFGQKKPRIRGAC
jgi:hypothetical protein